MNYKFIFCILSSKNLSEKNGYFSSNNKYDMLKGVVDKYFNKFRDDIKYFLVEYDNLINNEIYECENYIYVKGVESVIPGCLDKFKKAVKHINLKYDYDFLIHTNITTLWNLYNLQILYPTLPKNNFVGVHLIFNSFITGTGIMLSKDMTSNLLLINDNSDNNDVAISRFFQSKRIHFFTLNNLPSHKMNYQIEDTKCKDINSVHHSSQNLIPTDMENILYFRIKTSDCEKDIYITKVLINKLYDVSL